MCYVMPCLYNVHACTDDPDLPLAAPARYAMRSPCFGPGGGDAHKVCSAPDYLFSAEISGRLIMGTPRQCSRLPIFCRSFRELTMEIATFFLQNFQKLVRTPICVTNLCGRYRNVVRQFLWKYRV